MKIPERTKKYKQGLIDMIKWIDQFYSVKEMKIIEVGSWTGCASEIFAQYFHKVICIDLWKSNIGGITNQYDMKEVEKIFDQRANKYKGIIFKSKISSLEAAKIYQESVKNKDLNILPDVVYIDANHYYKHIKQDIKIWKDIPTKFLCGHDYEHRFKGVIKAVNELLGNPHERFKDSSWIFKL
jgi:hypothetical protein